MTCALTCATARSLNDDGQKSAWSGPQRMRRLPEVAWQAEHGPGMVESEVVQGMGITGCE
jgi:hypothetical protein